MSSCRFIREDSIPAARTNIELNTEAPRKSKNQVIVPTSTLWYGFRRIPVRRKKVRKKALLESFTLRCQHYTGLPAPCLPLDVNNR